MALMQTPLSVLVQSYIKTSPAYKAFHAEERSVTIQGLEGYPLSEFLRLVARKVKGRVWVICPTEDSALQLLKDSGVDPSPSLVMQTPLGGQEMRTLYLPGNGRKLYSPFQADNVEYEQLSRLSSIQEMKSGLIITHLRPFVAPVVLPTALEQSSLQIKKGSAFDSTNIAQLLTNAGYVHTVTTTTMGEFSLRGEVLDVFPFESENPYRIYADWDTVGKISTYNPITQETIATLPKFSISLFDAETGLATGSIRSYFEAHDFFCFVGDQRLATSYHSLELEAKALYRQAFLSDRQAPKPDELLFNFPAFQKEAVHSIVVLDIAGQKKRPTSSISKGRGPISVTLRCSRKS